MNKKKSKSSKTISTKKVRQKKLPIPGSAIHKSMVLSGEVKKKE
jgi:hypothetical protein